MRPWARSQRPKLVVARSSNAFAYLLATIEDPVVIQKILTHRAADRGPSAPAAAPRPFQAPPRAARPDSLEMDFSGEHDGHHPPRHVDDLVQRALTIDVRVGARATGDDPWSILGEDRPGGDEGEQGVDIGHVVPFAPVKVSV